MTTIQREVRVRLNREIPELLLNRGDVGIIKSKWCSNAYEVEFHKSGQPLAVRSLVFAEHIEILDLASEQALFNAEVGIDPVFTENMLG